MIDDILHFQIKYGERNCSFMVLGDLNSRIGNEPDYVKYINVNLNLENVLPDDYIVDNESPKVYEDKIVNQN